uniref:Gustatory receptor n=1 Tax=Heliothis virescens TaxID=7102 RepID=A0A2A4JRW1_HELVI
MMFELLWQRMTILRKCLEKGILKARRIKSEGGSLKRKLKQYLNTYKGILNTIHTCEKPMKIGSSELVAIEITIVAFETLSPALLAEMVKKEIDYMKLSVVKLLLVCKDEETRDAIQDAMMYFQHNPFEYTIWRLFAVDMSLILNMIALLTTYTVAMVQFAHFYD